MNLNRYDESSADSMIRFAKKPCVSPLVKSWMLLECSVQWLLQALVFLVHFRKRVVYRACQCNCQKIFGFLLIFLVSFVCFFGQAIVSHKVLSKYNLVRGFETYQNVLILIVEFDPGSERTLEVCLIHASLGFLYTKVLGGRVSIKYILPFFKNQIFVLRFQIRVVLVNDIQLD